jgi:hypothetical protein
MLVWMYSKDETEPCGIDGEGQRVWRGACPAQPEYIAPVLKDARNVVRLVVMGLAPSVSSRLHSRVACGGSAVVTGQQKGWERWHRLDRPIWVYREVAVKSVESWRIRALLSARGQFVAIRPTLAIQILGLVVLHGRPTMIVSHRGGELTRRAMSNGTTATPCNGTRSPPNAGRLHRKLQWPLPRPLLNEEVFASLALQASTGAAPATLQYAPSSDRRPLGGSTPVRRQVRTCRDRMCPPLLHCMHRLLERSLGGASHRLHANIGCL